MRFSTSAAVACGVLALTIPARAQTADSSGVVGLTLEQAVALALQNNPEYHEVVDQRAPAAARVRSAYAQFLPGAGVNMSAGYLGQGGILIGGVQGAASGSDQLTSSYGIGLTYNLAVATFVNPGLTSANLRAARHDITSAAATLRSNVTDAYLLVLVDEANAVLQDSLIVSNQIQVDLAKARLAAGSGTQLDLSKAQVGLGNQRIIAIRANNATQVDRLALFQLIGVPQPAKVQLTTRIPVTAPTFSLDSVLGLARASNPALLALEARESATRKAVTSAKGTFLPTLSINAGWSGYSNQFTNSNYPVGATTAAYNANFADCMMTDSLRVGVGLQPFNCSDPLLIPPPDTNAIKAANKQFPFKFTRSPFQATATFSLAIFDGLQRFTQVEDAQAQHNDARYRVQSQLLRLTADITSAYLTLIAANEAVALSRDNREQAELALKLAQERYRVGSATAVELSTQRDQYETAVEQLLTSIFSYHRAFAALERAVGRPLR